MLDQNILSEITMQLERQLHSFWIDIDIKTIQGGVVREAYERCMTAISTSRNKYLNPDGDPHFSLYHSGCWALFLYYLSNSLKNNTAYAEKIYYLNKILHNVDWYFEIELPAHFMIEHAVGSVLGRAKYGDYLFIYQGVTVGGSGGKYPVLGNYVKFFSDAKVVGNSYIGDHVVLSANSYVIDEDIPNDCIVFGQSPNLIIKHEPDKVLDILRQTWRNVE